jgi:hypothetical protein
VDRNQRPLEGEPLTVDLVVGYNKTNTFAHSRDCSCRACAAQARLSKGRWWGAAH